MRYDVVELACLRTSNRVCAPLERSVQQHVGADLGVCWRGRVPEERGDALLDLEPEPVLFIGGFQGRGGCTERIRRTAKLNGEISPASMLLLALQSLGAALDINAIAGVSATQQACIDHDANIDQYLSVYDGYWASAGGTIINGRYFTLAVTPHDKPILEIPKYNRTRTKKKRRLKQAIRAEIQQSLAQYFTT